MIKTPLAIIGSGFGGIGLAIKLQEAGYTDFLILEKANDVGGCWRDNHYPGAACDVPSHLYSFSFEPKFDWSRKFAPQREIHAYIRHCADKYNLWPHIRLNTEVTGASFDDARGVWRIATANGETVEATVLVPACGQLSRPAYPRLPGLDRFEGECFHSAHWHDGADVRGKRVAVIGTGASAIQFVPELVKQASALTLFQRTAPYVIPKPDRPYSRLEQKAYETLPLLQALSRTGMYWQHESRALVFGPVKQLMRVFEWDFKRHLNAAVKDPELRRKLTPDYPMGCKRILISNDYYTALAKPHVAVETGAIREVTAKGVRTADGVEHAADVIVYGTGFQATDFLAPMQITGRHGVSLNQAWRDGAEAYLGITVHGFPNLFMLYGPNTNLGHNSIVFMLERQFGYILQALDALRERGLQWVEVRAETQGRFNRWVQDSIRKTVWEDGCTSWYKTDSGKNTNNWPGFTLAYRWRTRHFEIGDYEALPQTAVQPAGLRLAAG